MLESIQALWESFWSIPHLRVYLTTAWLLYLVPLGFWIVLQKREPATFPIHERGFRWVQDFPFNSNR